MGVTVCAIHGRRHLGFTSRRLEPFARDRRPFAEPVFGLQLRLDASAQFLCAVDAAFLVENAIERAAGRDAPILIDDEDRAWALFGDLEPVCGGCLADALAASGAAERASWPSAPGAAGVPG